MKKLRKISTIAFLKFHSTLGGLVGFILGVLYSFGGLIIDTLVSFGWIEYPGTPGLSYGTLLAFGALVGMPVIFSFIGLVLGTIEWITYTLFARILPWLEINFEQKEVD